MQRIAQAAAAAVMAPGAFRASPEAALGVLAHAARLLRDSSSGSSSAGGGVEMSPAAAAQSVVPEAVTNHLLRAAAQPFLSEAEGGGSGSKRRRGRRRRRAAARAARLDGAAAASAALQSTVAGICGPESADMASLTKLLCSADTGTIGGGGGAASGVSASSAAAAAPPASLQAAARAAAALSARLHAAWWLHALASGKPMPSPKVLSALAVKLAPSADSLERQLLSSQQEQQRRASGGGGGSGGGKRKQLRPGFHSSLRQEWARGMYEVLNRPAAQGGGLTQDSLERIVCGIPASHTHVLVAMGAEGARDFAGAVMGEKALFSLQAYPVRRGDERGSKTSRRMPLRLPRAPSCSPAAAAVAFPNSFFSLASFICSLMMHSSCLLALRCPRNHHRRST